MLTPEGRRQFKLKMIPEYVRCRICSSCGLPAGNAPKKRHIHQDDLDAVSRQIRINPANRGLRAELHRIKSKIHWTSRCCGVPYKDAAVDNWEAIYESWKNRHSIVKVSIEILRAEGGKGCDDDFLLMRYIWSLSDPNVRYRIKLCRDEDVRQQTWKYKPDEIPVLEVKPTKGSGRRLLGTSDLLNAGK